MHFREEIDPIPETRDGGIVEPADGALGRARRGFGDGGPRGLGSARMPGRKAPDALEAPDGVEARDVRRSLDLEDLRAAAPDLHPERLRRIARVREQIREDAYDVEPRLSPAVLDRILRDLRRHGGHGRGH